jgi:RecA/RadA recombinase
MTTPARRGTPRKPPGTRGRGGTAEPTRAEGGPAARTPRKPSATGRRAAPKPRKSAVSDVPPFRLMSATEIDAMPDPEWLIDGLLPSGATVELYGPYGTAKSFIALGWACSVGSGAKWLGREVVKGAALFIAAEGGYGQRNRLRAWRADNDGINPDIDVIPDPVSFRNGEHVDYLCEIIENGKYRIVVIDTLTTTAGGLNQDSATDMGQYIDVVNRLRSAVPDHGTTVVIVHHAGYDKSHGRGSTALPSGVDVVVKVTSPDPRISIELHCDKVKDASPFEDIYARIEVVTVEGGTSCVVRELEDVKITLPKHRGQAAKTQAQLVALIRSKGRPVTTREAADELGVSVDAARSAFRRGGSAFVQAEGGTWDLPVGLS